MQYGQSLWPAAHSPIYVQKPKGGWQYPLPEEGAKGISIKEAKLHPGGSESQTAWKADEGGQAFCPQAESFQPQPKGWSLGQERHPH